RPALHPRPDRTRRRPVARRHRRRPHQTRRDAVLLDTVRQGPSHRSAVHQRPVLTNTPRKEAAVTRKLTALIIVIGGAATATRAGRTGRLCGFWRPMPVDPEPAGAQLAGLIAAGIVEAVGFGVALAILALGRPMFTQLTNTPTAKATAAQLAAAWLLGS